MRHPGVTQNCTMGRREINSEMVVVMVSEIRLTRVETLALVS